jgi:hypothetical protein
LVFIIHEQRAFPDGGIAQRNSAGKPGRTVNNDTFDTILGENLLRLPEQVAELAVVKTAYLKAHVLLCDDLERQILSARPQQTGRNRT